MTSSMLERVMRVITAIGIVPRAMAGMTRCNRPSQNPAKFSVRSESTSTSPVMAGGEGSGAGDAQRQEAGPEPREVQREERVDEHQPGYGGDRGLGAEAARERQPPKVHEEDHDQDHREPEDGHAYPREGKDRCYLVKERVLL